MSKLILVINAGSSSVKFSLFAEDSSSPRLRLRGQIESLDGMPRFRAIDARGKEWGARSWSAPADHDVAIQFLLDWIKETGAPGEQIACAAHRVVHGGTEFAAPLVVSAGALEKLAALIPLAPLHQPSCLAGIRIVASRSPGLPQVACFDTAFHRDQPAVEQAFALPRTLLAEGVRRYGFHGLSYESIAGTLAGIDPRAAAGRTIAMHLGAGASMCAMKGGKSVASTMGFTPLDGLPMATRPGAVDPGVILYLVDQRGLKPRELERLLYYESGLLGYSGISSDVRDLLASDDPRAAEALDLFVYRVSREVGSLAAALGGVDALVFTGGIGENSAIIRARVVEAAAWLGAKLDTAANQANSTRISAPDSKIAIHAIKTNEELVIATHAQRLCLSAT